MTSNRIRRRTLAAVTLAAAGWLLSSTAPSLAVDTSDWPMWGGTPNRNMVSDATGLPDSWDVETGRNIKWIADLGSQSYGNPVIAEGVVLVGTNNEALRNPALAGDRGVLMAFRESDGTFLWQSTHEKLASGRANDWPYQGVCSSPLVENGVAYYVSNRGEVLALDLQGFHDGDNDGPFREETATSETDADILWKFDMMEEVGAYPHNMSSSSPVAHGDLIFVNTSNGQDESHVNIPSPRAPQIIALNKHTGELVWEDNSVEDRILHGQWSSATIARIGDVDQVIMGQGDGWVRGYVAGTGEKLWEFNTNPDDAEWPRTRNNVIATAAAVDGVIYIANGQDPEHGEGVGHLYAIDPSGRGNITESGRLWHFDTIRRSISTAAVRDGLVYYPDFSGFFYCLDAKTGDEVWMHDMFAAVWGSPLAVDGRIYLGDEDGDIAVLRQGRELDVIAEMNMGSSVYSTPVPANGALFISTRNKLYAIAEGAQLQ